MEKPIEQAVTRAIVTMRENLGEQLSVDDIARAAMFSKFHFTRIFQRATGVSPRRFLSALRLQRAKQLLIQTSLTVADISMHVGYSSVGTFSSRFSRSVGMSPTAYRRMSGFAPRIQTDTRNRRGQSSVARVRGRLRFAEPVRPGLVFVGLFEERIPEGRPVRCAIIEHHTSFQFDTVPHGTWYLLAQGISGDPLAPIVDLDEARATVSVASHGPLMVSQGATLLADLTLRPVSTLDPPVLMALLDARELALRRAEARATHAVADIPSRNLVDADRPAA